LQHTKTVTLFTHGANYQDLPFTAKALLAFGLVEEQIYIDYDLIYIYNDMLFMGSKHADDSAFDTPKNRPTNLQIPLV
jgi:hypothetical protein